jgi:hypothetical protein
MASFKTAHNQWLTTDSSGLVQGGQSAQPWTLDMVGNDVAALVYRNVGGEDQTRRVVSVDDAGRLELAQVLTLTDREKFRLVPAGENRVALKSLALDRFVSVRPNGKVVCDRESASLHEMFLSA